jgi:hypothetical protein
MKLEIYVGFDAYGYSHEPKTKLYGLQLKKHENYVDFDVHACMNLKPSCVVCSSINLNIMLALMCMGTHMNLKPICMVYNSRNLKIMLAFICMGTHMNLKPSCMVCKSRDLLIKLVLVCISTHMNFKPSCMVCNSRNLFELETMLDKSMVVWLWNEGYVVRIKDLFWNPMTKYVKSKEWYEKLVRKMHAS